MVPLPGEMVFVEPVFCPQAVIDWIACGSKEKKKELMENGNVKSGEMVLRAKKHLSAVGWSFSYQEKKGKKPELQYKSPKGKYYHSLRIACIECMKDNAARAEMMQMQSMVRKRRNPSDENVDSKKQRKGKTLKVLAEHRDDLHGSNQKHLSRRAREIVELTPAHHKPRTVLSLLIDKSAVLENAKVYYIGRKDHRRMKGGRITRDGICCDCCHKVFTMSAFEAHADSTYRRPAASIFLEDGRSLLECQTQMLHKTQERVRRSCQPRDKSDYICSICHYGGELLLCDRCPSVFHLSCLGLKDLPEGKWFCPSCRCGLCGQGEFTAAKALRCDQCGREYHVGCLKERGLLNGWFCTKKCEKIFMGLHEILGKSFHVGPTANNLSWVILQSLKDGSGKSSDVEVMTDCHSKLNLALGVMHECFEPINEPYTNSDLIEDLIFSKWSKINRLNFQGFYTVLLQQGDELISVATVRIHNEKVAEVPFIATRLPYRRKGMCHLLMNELEKKLIKLGVETLVLPAAATVLNTWITCFGFSKMTDSERLKYIEYTFLNFQDTVMCKKMLKKMSSGNQGDECIDFDRCSIDSEVTPEDQIEQSEVEKLQQNKEWDEIMSSIDIFCDDFLEQ